MIEADRARFQRRVDLLIPIVKGWCTEMAQEVTHTGVQIHGGMGFIEETGAAQHMRDARILTIYEGTTGIQALDLMGRKLLRDKGQAMGELIEELEAFDAELQAGGETFVPIAGGFAAAVKRLRETTEWYLVEAANDPELGNAIGVNFMMMAGHVVCAWLMARAALAAQARIDAGAGDDFYVKKIKTAIFFAEHILPRSEGLASMIKAGKTSVMSISAEDF